MFKLDNPIVQFFNKIADIIFLNLLALVCSIPIITIGASWTATYYVTVKMVRGEESYIWKDFFKSFKQNFLQATAIWLINIAVIAVLLADMYIMANGLIKQAPKFLYVAALFTVIVVLIVMVYVYPVLSHFANTIGKTIKNALLLAVANLPYTVLFVVLTFGPLAIMFVPSIGLRVLPIYILIGIAGPAYLASVGWRRIFDRLDPNKDQGDDDGQEESQESK